MWYANRLDCIEKGSFLISFGYICETGRCTSISYVIRPTKACWIGIQPSTKVLEQGNNVFVPQAMAYVFRLPYQPERGHR